VQPEGRTTQQQLQVANAARTGERRDLCRDCMYAIRIRALTLRTAMPLERAGEDETVVGGEPWMEGVINCALVDQAACLVNHPNSVDRHGGS
jgi:hypothetical protein